VIREQEGQLKSVDQKAVLMQAYSASEVEEFGYELVPRYVFGPFRAKTGCINIDMHFDKQFSEQTLRMQKRDFARILLDGVDRAECGYALAQKES